MKYALVFRPEVLEDLDRAHAWYERQKPGLGDEFLDSIDAILQRVCLVPNAYSIVYRDVRRAVAKRFPYAAYYRITSSDVVVIAVFHGRRDPTFLQGRR